MKKEACLINTKSKKIMETEKHAQGAFNSESQRDHATLKEA
jgi:hypothetical protein